MEEDTFVFDDYKNAIIVRNQLLGMDIESLKELYKDPDNYIGFLDTIAVMSKFDCGFFFLNDEILDRIQIILQLNRFSMKNEEGVYETVNEIIDFTNEVKSYSEDDKNVLRLLYLEYQQELRNIVIMDNESFGYVLTYDAVVLVDLINHTLEHVESDEYFLSSVNYLIECFPELFEDSSIQVLVEDRIQSIKDNSKFFSLAKKYSKYTEKNYQKLKNL